MSAGAAVLREINWGRLTARLIWLAGFVAVGAGVGARFDSLALGFAVLFVLTLLHSIHRVLARLVGVFESVADEVDEAEERDG